MRLSLKLPILTVLTVMLSAASVGTIAVRAATSAATDDALRTATRSAQMYAQAVSAHISDATMALEVTAREAEAAGHDVDAAQWRPTARALVDHSNVFEYVMLLGPDGSIRMVEPRRLEAQLITSTLAGQSWAQEVVASGRAVVSNLNIAAATRRPSVVIAVPVRAPGSGLLGVWAAGLELKAFSQFARASTAGERAASSGHLADGNGLIVAHQANPDYVRYQTDFSSEPSVRHALGGHGGSGRWRNPFEGQEKLGAWIPVEIAGKRWAAVYSMRVEDALASVPPLTRRIALSSLAIALALALAGAVVGRRLTAPLRELADTTARVTAGDLSVRAPPATGEAGEVAARFNGMVARLADREADLRRQANALEAANRELEAFAYSVSHDLRAPLRSIDGFSQVLVEDFGPSLDDEARDHLDRVRAAAQRMGALIDDLLRLSRVAQADLHLEQTDLTAIAERVLGELRAAEPHRAVRAVVDDGLSAVADPGMAEVVIRNLVGNAWKFTSKTPDPSISVGAASPGWFIVSDNGAGFDMAYADRLFTPFQRLHTTGDFPGTGIGLATVRRVLRRHGGDIRAHATLGGGATFAFTFSASQTAPPTDDDAVADDLHPAMLPPSA